MSQSPEERPDRSASSSLTGPSVVTAVCLVLCLGLLLALAPDSSTLAALGAEAEASSPTVGRDEALARARESADALTRDLMGHLTRELSEGGPGRAIQTCSRIAQEIAERHSVDPVQGQIRLRRVSRKVRNPADEPTAYEMEQLEHLAELHRHGDLPEETVEVVERGGERTLHYLRPITVQPMCLQCHGDPETFAPEVHRILAELYPDDQAVGYEVGDLRGAISLAVPLD